ncbi:MAG: hypothetical protein ACM30I_09150 [Gemmatimonas sp.]
MTWIRLAAAAALVLGTGVAMAQDRSNAVPPAGGADTSAPSNASQGATGGGYSSHKALDDKNANPDSAISRGEIDESSVKSLLQSRGYADVRDLKRSGDAFTATAYKDNRVVRVTVDAKTGNITDTNL